MATGNDLFWHLVPNGHVHFTWHTFFMKIAYDVSRRRPGCALVQAGMGCSGMAASLFPTETWLLAPTQEMKVYEASEEQLGKLVQITVAQHGKDTVGREI